MRAALVALALLFPSLASAGEQVEAVLGWTADGQHLVTRSIEESAWYGEEEGDEGHDRLDWRVVHDLGAGSVEKYLVDFESIQGLQVGEVPLKDAWEAWSAANPLTAAPSGPAGPGGAKAVVRRCDDHGDGVWADGRMELGGEETCVELGVETGGKTWWTTRQELPAAAMYMPSYALRVVWSPSGDTVVWLLDEAGGTTMRGPVFPSTDLVARRLAPRIEVLSTADLAETGRRRVTAALLLADAGAVLEGTAVKARESTVIYAGQGQADLAKRLAAQVPGGATVEALTWKANGDLVVAVGSSAAP